MRTPFGNPGIARYDMDAVRCGAFHEPAKDFRLQLGIARMDLDLKKVAAFMRKTTDEDLLDRVTVYRDQMEPAALDLFEGELSRRGIDDATVAEHGADFRSDALENSDGTIARCSFCGRPAVDRARGWHRLWRRIPLFPRIFSYCRSHAPAPEPTAS